MDSSTKAPVKLAKVRTGQCYAAWCQEPPTGTGAGPVVEAHYETLQQSLSTCF